MDEGQLMAQAHAILHQLETAVQWGRDRTLFIVLASFS